MPTTFSADEGVESTIALLERELPALQEQQQRLEGELKTVTERLEVVRSALDSLRALVAAPALRPSPAAAEAVAEAEQRHEAAEAAESAAAPEDTETAETTEAVQPTTRAKGRRTTGTARTRTTAKSSTRKPAKVSRKKAAPAATHTETQKPTRTRKAAAPKATPAPAGGTPSLTDAIASHLAAADGPVRARDVAQALGRDGSQSAINAVRTSLERLAKASRAQRVGRGLYAAAG
ncbi:hypothetical protein ACFC1R_06600 [Kitasatospora sp. NPDC056138]|uniref:hypothetical protein n=1 Tax=Kitasatospora sp. NPDC056138 TaxID=3345724 RepID=UPI0035DFC9AD